MKTSNLRSLGALFCILSGCILFPMEARADAINFGFLAVAGGVVAAPLTLFVVLVEGFVLSIGLKIPFRRTIWAMVIANVLSLMAGFPVKLVEMFKYQQLLPRPLAPYFRLYPYVAFLWIAVYFGVTLISEYVVVALWRRIKRIEVSRGRLAMVVLVANLATYAVLAPLYYLVTRPTCDVREFTDEAAWAASPVTELLYINSTGNLCAVTTDGSNMRLRVPGIVRDYQYIPSQGIYLYRDGSNNLCLYRESDGSRVQCWRTREKFMMEQVACSPDGALVAYLARHGQLKPGEPFKPYELVLLDIQSGRSANTGIFTEMNDYEPEIAWSAGPSRLFIRSRRKLRSVVVAAGLTVVAQEPGATNNVTLAEVYGRFGSGHWWGASDWGTSFSRDTNQTVSAFILSGFGSYLSVTRNNKTFKLADNPGILGIGNRQFNDLCLLANGEELVFDDRNDIYLMDLGQRKVGRIAEGTRFITISPRYRREFF